MVRYNVALGFAVCLSSLVWAQQSPAGPATNPATPTTQTTAVPAEDPNFPFDHFKEFSAVMVGSVQPKDTRESHIYRSGDLVRTEGPLSRAFMITHVSTGETEMVSKKGCLKSSRPFFRAYPFFLPGHGRKIERMPAGKETLEGHVCAIEDLTVTGQNLAVQPIRLRFWEAEDLHGFPIKIDIQAGKGPHSTIQYKDVVLAPPDETLFIYSETCNDLDNGDDDDAPPAKSPAPADNKKPQG